MKKKRKFVKRVMKSSLEQVAPGTCDRHRGLVEKATPITEMTLKEQSEYWQSRYNEEHDRRNLQDVELRTIRWELETANKRSARYERVIDRLTGVRE